MIEAGYSGYSMSNNAVAAYEDGEKPISKWTKSDILQAVQDNYPDKYEMLKKLPIKILKEICLVKTSWHHTSSHYNKTDFYSIRDLDDLTQDYINDIVASASSRPVKSQPNIKRGTINYIEWTGTRNHPKANKKQLDNVNIEERGSFYIVTDDKGNEILRKKIGSNGTYVNYN